MVKSGRGVFCFDPWVLYRQGALTNPNCLLAGVLGKGKSCLAKSLATRSVAFGRRVYAPGDPKGEWSAVAEAAANRTIESDDAAALRDAILQVLNDPGYAEASAEARSAFTALPLLDGVYDRLMTELQPA